jgi:hypothetical protein
MKQKFGKAYSNMPRSRGTWPVKIEKTIVYDDMFGNYD